MTALRKSLTAGYPGRRQASGIPGNNAPAMQMQIVLTLDQLLPYDRNPRRVVNPMRDDLKASIRERGLDMNLSVTQRPGDVLYIVEAGGNTRLSILKELWEETKDERFWRTQALFKPWRGELHVLTAHMVENLLHADMAFADKAEAVYAIKEEIEREEEAEINWAETEKRLQGLGLPISHAQMARMRYLIEMIKPISTNELLAVTGPYHVDKMQEAINACVASWEGDQGDVEAFLSTYSDPLRDLLADSGKDIVAAIRGVHGLAEELRAEYGAAQPDDALEEPEPAARSGHNGAAAQEDGALNPQDLAQDPWYGDDEDVQYGHYGEDTDGADESAEARHVPEPVRKLQQVVNLRSRCYALARSMLDGVDAGGAVLVPSDSGFGFDIHMSGRPSAPETWFLSTIAAARGLNTDTGIPVHAWGALSNERADMGLMLMRHIRDIMQLAMQTEDDTGVSTPWDLSNKLLMSVQDRLDPVTAEASRLIPEFIKHEASAAMMVSLFDGMTVSEVQLLRVELGISTNGGRPIKPLPYEVKRLWDKWLDMELNAPDISERERYLFVAKDVELPLSTVWNEIRSRVHKDTGENLEDDEDE